MREDSTYRVQFQEAQCQAAGMLEDEAVRRAHDGVKKLILYKGKPVMIQGEPLFEHQYSDMLLIRLLEAYNPERFGRRYEDAQVWDGDLAKLSPQQLAKVVDQLQWQLTNGDEAKIAALRQKALEKPAREQTLDVKPNGAAS
jgi:hypothetical protein